VAEEKRRKEKEEKEKKFNLLKNKSVKKKQELELNFKELRNAREAYQKQKSEIQKVLNYNKVVYETERYG